MAKKAKGRIKNRERTITQINPKRVRYIKLGEGGMWEQECREKNFIRLGFDSARDERFEICSKGDWNALRESFIAEGKAPGTATRFRNEIQIFFEADEETLWITFMDGRLYWGFLDAQKKAQCHNDQKGVYRPIKGGWKSEDINGEPLTVTRLAGFLTQLAYYRGTSCNVGEGQKKEYIADYTIRRINGEKLESVIRAEENLLQLIDAISGLLTQLREKDFEILVDLVFSTSGWRRQGNVGGSERTLDLDLLLPSTGERAFVQIKSKTTQREFQKYLNKFNDAPYDKMFYVFHTYSGAEFALNDDRVRLIDRAQIAKMVIDAGLTQWVMDKVACSP
jgi:hypothetical protein